MTADARSAKAVWVLGRTVLGRTRLGVIGAAVLVAGWGSSGMAQAATGAPDQLQVGDRVALTVEQPFAFSDTVVVREGLMIRIPNLGDISVKGVRRADTQRYLTQQIARYVRDPVVRAVPLVRVAITGQVGRPGFYSVPSDMLLSDVVMRAGGPTGSADLDKTVVRRAGKEVIGESVARNALSTGQTLDDLRVASGDEVVVGEKSEINARFILSTIGLLAPLIYLTLYFLRR